MRTRTIGRLVAPRIFPPVGAARRFFPFRFRGQAFTYPPAVCNGTVPRCFDDGDILEAAIGRPFAVAPMNMRVVVVDVEIFSPLDFADPRCLENCELSVESLSGQ
jgi:hypothetical protein